MPIFFLSIFALDTTVNEAKQSNNAIYFSNEKNTHEFYKELLHFTQEFYKECFDDGNNGYLRNAQ